MSLIVGLLFVVPVLVVAAVLVSVMVLLVNRTDRTDDKQMENESVVLEPAEEPSYGYWPSAAITLFIILMFIVLIYFKLSRTRSITTSSPPSVFKCRYPPDSDKIKSRPWYVPIPQDFDVEMELFLQYGLAHPGRPLLGDIPLESFECLYNATSWVSNDTVTRYVGDLFKIYNRTKNSRTCFYVPEFVYSDLVHGNKDMTYINGEIFKVSDYQMIYFPFTTGCHQHLIIADNEKNMVWYYDSRLTHDEKSLNMIVKYFEDNSKRYDKDPKKYETKNLSEPRQYNTIDCCVFVMTYVFLSLQGYDLERIPFDSEDVPYFRRRIACKFYLLNLEFAWMIKKETYLGHDIPADKLVRLFNIFIAHEDKELVANIVKFMPKCKSSKIRHVLDHVSDRDACLELMRHNPEIYKAATQCRCI